MRVLALAVALTAFGVAAHATDGPCPEAWKDSGDPKFSTRVSIVGLDLFGIVQEADFRVEVGSCSDAKVQANARGVVALLRKDIDFTDDPANKQIVPFISKLANLRPRLEGNETPLCKAEKFQEQFRVANCTGVVVAPDLVLTAAHCVERRTNTDTSAPFDIRIVLDLTLKNGNPAPAPIKSSELQLVEWAAAFRSTRGSFEIGGEDWALIKLRSRLGRDRVVRMRVSDDNLSAQNKIYGLSHPTGLPMKLSPNGIVADISDTDGSNAFFMRTDLAIFGGSSGAPVFNLATHELEGLVKSGPEDFFLDKKNQCATSLCALSPDPKKACARLQTITRINSIPPWARQLIAESNASP